MKISGITKIRMSTIFSISLLFAAILISLYVVLKANIKNAEGFGKLQPMSGGCCKNPYEEKKDGKLHALQSGCCGTASAHKVPLWQSSIYIDKESDHALERKNAEMMERYAKSRKENPIKKTREYDFLDTEIEVEEKKPLPPDPSKSKLLGLGIAEDPMKKYLDKRVRRPKMTKATMPISTQLLKGNKNSLWFGK